MSLPVTDCDNASVGVIHELISGMSALNMEPRPMDNPPEDAQYLSETDEHVAHAMEHFQAAFTLAQRCERLEAAVSRFLIFSDFEGVDPLRFTDQDFLNGLRQETENAKKRIRLKDKNKPLADRVVEEIIKDLTERDGLRREWDQIHELIREEIRCAWAGIVLQETSE